MLKRHQVLLEDWQIEYLKGVSDAYDFSLSETLRILYSLGLLVIGCALHPQYKTGLTNGEIKKMLRKIASKPLPQEELHSYVSKMYFEARKVAEHRLPRLKKRADGSKSAL